MAHCPRCHSVIPSDETACRICGFDTVTGEMTTPMTAERDRPRQRDAAWSRRRMRWEYYKPLLMILIAGGILLTIIGVMHDPTTAVVTALFYLIVEIPIGLVVFWLCSILWIGMDAPLHLTALRLAAVYAVADLVGFVLGFIPILFVGWLLMLFVYIGLLMDMLDLDAPDAIGLAIATFLVKFAIISVIYAAFMGAF